MTRLVGSLASPRERRHSVTMDLEDDVTHVLEALFDIRAAAWRIVELLEEGGDDEEE